jgi:hypothetical protein
MNDYMKETKRLLDAVPAAPDHSAAPVMYIDDSGQFHSRVSVEQVAAVLGPVVDNARSLTTAPAECLHGVRIPHECKACSDAISDADIAAWANSQTTAPAEVPMPEPDTHCFDEDTKQSVWSHSREQMCQYGNAREAAGYARILKWAVSRWKDEVQNRPLENRNYRPLDDAWRQVVRMVGGDPAALLGPSHDELLAARKGDE